MILVVTSESDASATYVCDLMSTMGVGYRRWNTETFPSTSRLDWRVVPDGTMELLLPDGPLDLGSVTSVWYRRPAPPTISDRITDPCAREFAQIDCERVLESLWNGVGGPWINHPHSNRQASYKPHQLQRAQSLGFKVPDTLITSDPSSARQFWIDHQQLIVFKALHQEALLHEGLTYLPYTGIIGPDGGPDLVRVEFCPVILQEYIRSSVELRITIIGNEVFTAVIDTSRSDHPDWRRLHPDDQAWKPFNLDSAISNKCIMLLQEYGLAFGAIDMIMSETGDYYFLELNPNGQWVWIEIITGLPIARALIGKLESFDSTDSRPTTKLTGTNDGS